MAVANEPPSPPRFSGCFLFGDYQLDLDRSQLIRGGEALSLSPKAFSLLYALIRNVDQVVASRSLLDTVWFGVSVEPSVLKVRIAEIRAALNETAAAPTYIHTHQRVGYRFAGSVRYRGKRSAGDSQTVVALSERPALAILAFNDFSTPPVDDYFADGIVEELTTRLARFRYFPVIARNSTFAFKGRDVDICAISRELGARYVLEGSVQRSEDQVRIIVQLIDGQTNRHVWTDRFDTDLTNIFEINDEMTDLIAGAMHGQLYAFEERRAALPTSRNLDAWHCLMRAWALQSSLDRDENASAKIEFKGALQLDPHCAQAYSGLAMCHFRDVLHGWSADGLESVRAARRHANNSLRCDAQDPYCHLASAVAYWLEGQSDELLAAIEHAVWLNPSLAWAYLWGGIAYGVAGNPERSMEMALRAIRLSPLDPLRGLFDYAVSVAHFSAGEYAEAFEVGKRAAAQLPDWGWPHCTMAAAAGLLDRMDEATAARELAQDRLPELNMQNIGNLLPFASTDFMVRIVEGAKRAGWRD